MSKIAQFACDVLKRYAEEAHTMLRCTSDLSPLEQWLIVEWYKECKKSSLK